MAKNKTTRTTKRKATLKSTSRELIFFWKVKMSSYATHLHNPALIIRQLHYRVVPDK